MPELDHWCGDAAIWGKPVYGDLHCRDFLPAGSEGSSSVYFSFDCGSAAGVSIPADSADLAESADERVMAVRPGKMGKGERLAAGRLRPASFTRMGK